jgi:hypothetical protein
VTATVVDPNYVGSASALVIATTALCATRRRSTGG